MQGVCVGGTPRKSRERGLRQALLERERLCLSPQRLFPGGGDSRCNTLMLQGSICPLPWRLTPCAPPLAERFCDLKVRLPQRFPSFLQPVQEPGCVFFKIADWLNGSLMVRLQPTETEDWG